MVLPRKIKHNNGISENAITIIFVEHASKNEKGVRNAIIVNTYESSFRDAVKINFMMEENTVFVIDPAGTVISHNDKEEFIKNYSSYEYIKSTVPKILSILLLYKYIEWTNGYELFIRMSSVTALYLSITSFSLRFR